MITPALPAATQDLWMTIPDAPAMPIPAQTGMADVNGIQMYYATSAAENPVLFLHGGLGYADIWANQVIELMADRLIIVADSPGHGRSTRNTDPYGYDLMTAPGPIWVSGRTPATSRCCKRPQNIRRRSGHL